MIAQEEHKDGDLHLHAFLRFDRKVNVVSPSKFDLQNVLGGSSHGNYQTCRNDSAVRKYCEKGGVFIESEAAVKTDDVYAKVLAFAKDGDVTGALQLLGDERPRDMVHRCKEITANLYSLVPLDQYQAPPDFAGLRLPLGLTALLPSLGKKSLIVHGLAGTGKTCWARSLGPHRFVTHLDQLRAPPIRSGELLVFDDMSFAHMPRTAVLHLVDCEQPRSIHVRYATAVVPALVRKLFLSNMEPAVMLGHHPDAAIERRYVAFHVTAKLYGGAAAIAAASQGSVLSNDGYDSGGGGGYAAQV